VPTGGLWLTGPGAARPRDEFQVVSVFGYRSHRVEVNVGVVGLDCDVAVETAHGQIEDPVVVSRSISLETVQPASNAAPAAANVSSVVRRVVPDSRSPIDVEAAGQSPFMSVATTGPINTADRALRGRQPVRYFLNTNIARFRNVDSTARSTYSRTDTGARTADGEESTVV